MITCRDVLNLKMDGVELIAGENGLDRMVSWTYMVQTRPYKDHMNQGNLPLFYVRWEGASFVDIAQSVGELLLDNNVQNKRTGDYLYNLLFGYDISKSYQEAKSLVPKKDLLPHSKTIKHFKMARVCCYSTDMRHISFK